MLFYIFALILVTGRILNEVLKATLESFTYSMIVFFDFESINSAVCKLMIGLVQLWMVTELSVGL